MKSETDYELDRTYKFSLKDIVGKSSTSEVYMGYDKKQFTDIAVKTESQFTLHPQLEHEYSILSYLNAHTNSLSKFFPTPIKYTKYGNKNYLIMELLGYNLEQLFSLTKQTFSPLTTFILISQMLDIIKQLHTCTFIHRDIKPEHFLLSKQHSTDLIEPALDYNHPTSIDPHSKLYLVDYGLTKHYCDPLTKKHLPFKDDRSFNGGTVFASSWSHLNIEKSRRDDLDSLSFILIYFLTGALPWQHLKTKTKRELNENISEMKIALTPTELCKCINIEECLKFVHCIRGLQFEQTPDYNYLKGLLHTMIGKLNVKVTNKKLYMILINNKPDDPVNQTKKEEMEDEDNDNNDGNNKNRKNDYNNNKYRISRKLKRDEVVKKSINK